MFGVDIFDLSAHFSEDSDPIYVDQLKSKMQATQGLVTAIVQLSGKRNPGILQDQVYKQSQKFQTEVRVTSFFWIAICSIITRIE